jgi:hypothetical protein
VKRAFEILHVQLEIVRGPPRFGDQEVLWYIMNTCVIMHITLLLRTSVANHWTIPSMN